MRRLAALTVMSEEAEQKCVNGEPLDITALYTLTSSNPLSTVHRRFAFARLSQPHPPGYPPDAVEART
jgi:hypothetical protein